jgi:hypothetical protein
MAVEFVTDHGPGDRVDFDAQGKFSESAEVSG